MFSFVPKSCQSCDLDWLDMLNLNFAHWTLDWSEGHRHREEHFEPNSGLSCLFSPPIRPIWGGFRDGHKRQTGTQGMHNSQLETTDQLEIFERLYFINRCSNVLLKIPYFEDSLAKYFELIMKCEMVPMRKGCWCFGRSVLSSLRQTLV